jgi:hypothetical protein
MQEEQQSKAEATMPQATFVFDLSAVMITDDEYNYASDNEEDEDDELSMCLAAPLECDKNIKNVPGHLRMPRRGSNESMDSFKLSSTGCPRSSRSRRRRQEN